MPGDGGHRAAPICPDAGKVRLAAWLGNNKKAPPKRGFPETVPLLGGLKDVPQLRLAAA